MISSNFARICLGTVLTLSSWRLQAVCIDLVKGPVVIDINSCQAIQPEVFFSTGEERFQNIKQLDQRAKSQFYNSYRGFLIQGKVVHSDAAKRGDVDSPAGALKGETHGFFIPQGQMPACLPGGQRLSGQIEEVCCDGGAASPCLMNTSLKLKSVKSLGASSAGGGQPLKQKSMKSEDYLKADQALARKDYKAAVELYGKAKNAGALDTAGLFKFGFAYRALDDCTKAIPPLREVYELFLNKKDWSTDEKVVRENNFLLARCYAKLNQPGASVLVLQGYLLESKKYRNELSRSLTHRDFGYIHTSKEYRDYKRNAEDKLRN